MPEPVTEPVASSPPPTPLPQAPTDDARQQLIRLAEALSRYHSSRMLAEFLRLRRGLRGS